ncbi:hypothetical protein FP2506_01140 [Fulvimarina pelagi HTCC2506]|uniref:Uncharacterized protein n=1 Tax=Fulvimarina pelagi HTCC2506 TaxID=314231 RepID=Q0G269_9HYPH|nr:hypothetical protein [Fulvimarina pelagi]EAU41329.1 hypothetical protein FP2506_01140 [Fulvimarina pelagi HTCC2506]
MTGSLSTLRCEEITYDSRCEAASALVLDTAGIVARMGSQAGPYHWFENGVRHEHYFDLVYQRFDGVMVFVAVRPRASSQYERLRSIVRLVRAHDPRLRDCEIQMLDRRHCPPWRVQRALVIRSAWDEADRAADRAFLEALRGRRGAMRIDEAAHAAGIDAEPTLCAGRLLMLGHLELEPETLLVDGTLVRAANRR